MGKLIDMDIYRATSIELKKYIEQYVQDNVSTIVVPKDTYLEFPLIGKDNCLYVDTTANRIYRWDSENVKYYCVGADYGNIKVISGGNSVE